MYTRKSLIILSITVLFATSFVGAKSFVQRKVDAAQGYVKKLHASLSKLDRCLRKGDCTPEELSQAKATAAKITGMLAAIGAVSGAIVYDRYLARTKPLYISKTGLLASKVRPGMQKAKGMAKRGMQKAKGMAKRGMYKVKSMPERAMEKYPETWEGLRGGHPGYFEGEEWKSEEGETLRGLFGESESTE